MMKSPHAFLIACALINVAQSGQASIGHLHELNIDWTNAADAHTKATWSGPDDLTISEGGLGWDGDPASARSGWIQTVPKALGVSWRPPRMIHVRAAIYPPPIEIDSSMDRKMAADPGDVYVRYSPDLKHWSSWQILQRTQPETPEEKETPGRYYGATVRVPECELDEYHRLLGDYWKEDVPWKSDEEAAVRWVLARQPDFFSRHLPFIGYAQFRFEGSFYGGQRLKSLKVHIGYCMGGASEMTSLDTKTLQERQSRPWSFRAEDSSEPEPIARPIQPGGWVAPAKD